MLRSLFRKSSPQINSTCVQLSHLFSTKNLGGNDTDSVPNLSVKTDTPQEKLMKCFKRDKELLKRKLTFWKNWSNPTINDKGKVLDWDSPHSPIFSNYCDVVIIGGGAMGISTAYWLQVFCRNSLNIIVIEKDPTYKSASSVLSVGGVRQQFSLEENIEMSLFGAEFIRNANKYLGILGEPVVDLQFHPYGYLSLATEDKVDILKKNSKLQNSKGAKNVLLTKNQLKDKFPWLTTDDIELGCLGLEKEGWFDPWLLVTALKRKAISMGVEFVIAEAKGFNFKVNNNITISGINNENYEELGYLIVQTEDGNLRPIHFSKCVIAAGAFSGQVAKMARIGYGENTLSVPLPVEPRKRYVYCFHAPDGPGLNTPMTIDPTGVYFRREGLNNHYICGRCPLDGEEPSINNLDVDLEFFDNSIWPTLAHRVKAFENLKVKSSWAGYYEYNTFDENGIIGYHPYYHNLLFATGFSGHGIQQAPAVGRGIAELIIHNEFVAMDLTRLSFDRFITQEAMRESNIW
ncbi:FAD-dependent oxidoreductase domain-containing protein 1-like [Phymastichus coffea]|uniref:FAD-dependent oxidoreductase domain-containing protein 1-like n=1 Tax=Phymastichus coffea TaxID=108790 RepID=UPI00273AF654|nr:FAD-dependent oxidoreductase domain-containing protein 1-like [Phymastichus coffea]